VHGPSCAFYGARFAVDGNSVIGERPEIEGGRTIQNTQRRNEGGANAARESVEAKHEVLPMLLTLRRSRPETRANLKRIAELDLLKPQSVHKKFAAA
jgi:hypothetical protein